jgi:cyclic pyranopterin phosphate synthase
MDDRPSRPDRRRLTHVDRGGRPRMVDVSAKPPTARRAVAEAEVACSQETLSLVIDGAAPKGDVLTVAEMAGVLAAKRTADLIPLCHPLPLTDVVVQVTPDRAASALRVRAEAATTAPTGVEMEALTAAAIAALTIYDMVKGVERGVEVRSLRLLAKSGGTSGDWHRPITPAEVVAPRQKPKATRGPGRAGGIRRSSRRPGG